MRRSIRPALELLEGKALLAGGVAAASGLVDTLTAVAGRTASGAQVSETFTATNASDHDITVDHGPGNDGFTVTQGGKVVYNPDAGILPQFIAVEVLKPHQSLTITNTWDVRSNLGGIGQEGPPISGSFTITDGLAPGGPSATVTIPRSWTVPEKLTHVVPPRPAPHVPAPAHPATAK